MPRWAASPAGAALLAALTALFFSFGPARATDPDAVFPKYLEAATAPPAERAERLLDYSPLYLGLVRAATAVLPQDPVRYRAILALQCLLHAATAAAVALAVALLAGGGDSAVGAIAKPTGGAFVGLLAGLGVAAYRPFLTYCGVHEPETLILACLSGALLAGVLARRQAALAAGTPTTSPESDESRADSPSRRRRFTLAASLAFAGIALAALGRPQHLALVPIWAWWMTAGAPDAIDPISAIARRALRRRTWLLAVAVPALFLGPPVIARSLAVGAPTLMDPGPVLYEGNAPAAVGLIRWASPALLALESAHPETSDYGHVAYRRIAAAALGHPLGSPAANRWWAGLAVEGIRAWPEIAVRRFARKALLALSPYEGHDLVNAERNDRRLRPLLPWGFALPLLGLVWIPLARRERWTDLAGPLALAALAVLLQTVAYASARQRLPVALGLWIVMPVLAGDLFRHRLRWALRPSTGLLLGIAIALAAGAASGRTALLDRLQWDHLLGTAPASFSESLLAFQEGRAQRPALAAAARRFSAGVDLAREGRFEESLRALAPLLGTGADFTIDDRTVGVPEHWAALDLLALGRREEARQLERRALAGRPQDLILAAFDRRLAASSSQLADWPIEVDAWRPAGIDPLSARIALARAAVADGDRAAAGALLGPLSAGFPELLGR